MIHDAPGNGQNTSTGQGHAVPLRVLLADDQALLRGAFRALLDSDDIAVVGEASDGREAVALTRALRPDVVVMDIRMPDMDGLTATLEICADPDLRATRVLILTTYETDEYIAQALRAWASGFIGKGIETQDLLDAVRAIADGDTSCPQPRPGPWWPVSSPRRLTLHHAVPNNSPRSPRANARWSLWSRPVCPTWRSLIGCTSAPSPSAPTCSAP
jgi:DNA-binding NarL/FixJ family response regulator